MHTACFALALHAMWDAQNVCIGPSCHASTLIAKMTLEKKNRQFQTCQQGGRFSPQPNFIMEDARPEKKVEVRVFGSNPGFRSVAFLLFVLASPRFI